MGALGSQTEGAPRSGNFGAGAVLERINNMELRPYQSEILDAVFANYRAGIRRMVVSAATGTGKSFVFSQIPALMRAELQGQTLCLVHTEELVDQNAEELRESNPDLSVDVEMAERHADPNADIVVASVPTLGRAHTTRRDKFNWDNITICITDECHHSVSDTYKRIFEAGGFLDADTKKLLVGFTATPNRSDGTPLKEVYEKIIYDYPIRRGIDEEWLCDLTGERVDTRTCLDYVHTTKGEFNQTELAETVNTPERNALIVDAWIKKAAPRKTVAFTVNIQHAQDLAKAFQQRGIAAEASWGTDPSREKKLARHQSGETVVLTNCAILLEGYNDPSIACVVLARPTKSALLFTQAIGRGTRICEGKQNCLIMDVVDATKRHSLASLASLLGFPRGLNLRGHSAVAALKVLEDAAREYPHVDLSGLRDLSKLQEFIEHVNLWEVRFPEEVVEHSTLTWFKTADGYALSISSQERATIKQNLLGKFEVSITLGGQTYSGERETLADAFQAADTTVEEHDSRGDINLLKRQQRWHKDAATEKQLGLLKRLYEDKVIPADLTKGAACKLIAQFYATHDTASQSSDAATEKQLGYLKMLRHQGRVGDYPADISRIAAQSLISQAVQSARSAQVSS